MKASLKKRGFFVRQNSFRETFAFQICGFLLRSELVPKTPTLKPTLNQADIDLLMLVFPTKAGADQQLEKSEQRQSIKYDNVITLLDDIISELKTIREEQVMIAYHSKDHTDQIAATKSNVKNHEKRISKLELVANFA